MVAMSRVLSLGFGGCDIAKTLYTVMRATSSCLCFIFLRWVN